MIGSRADVSGALSAQLPAGVPNTHTHTSSPCTHTHSRMHAPPLRGHVLLAHLHALPFSHSHLYAHTWSHTYTCTYSLPSHSVVHTCMLTLTSTHSLPFHARAHTCSHIPSHVTLTHTHTCPYAPTHTAVHIPLHTLTHTRSQALRLLLSGAAPHSARGLQGGRGAGPALGLRGHLLLQAALSSTSFFSLLWRLENPKHSQEGKQALYYLVGSEHCIAVIESGLTQIAFSEEP